MSKMGRYVFDLMEKGEYNPEDYGWHFPEEGYEPDFDEDEELDDE